MNSQNGSLAKLAIALLPLTILFVGCDVVLGPSIRGSGISKVETRAVAPFSEIEVGSAIELDAKISPADNLVVTTDDNLLQYVKTEVVGGRLKIYLDARCSTDLGIKVQATAPMIRALGGSGASTTALSGVTGEQFELDLSGASSCQLNGDAELMKVTLSGASQSTIVGRAKQVIIDCSGASQLDATGLAAQTVVADLSGASTAHLNAMEELTADASGASTLHYVGQPAKVETSTSGASSIAATVPTPSASFSEAEILTDSPSDD